MVDHRQQLQDPRPLQEREAARAEVLPGKRRLLVGIASHGNGHLHFLHRLLDQYRAMSFDTDIVVFSDAAKQLGPDVEVIVGAPGRNPWTLPFAHKRVFAERVEQYDAFVYTEDDIDLREESIESFLELTPALAPDEIAGFLRYEVAPNGEQMMAEPWGHYHWDPHSVQQRGPHLLAAFTNEHSGCYALTRAQLKRAIASGGYLRSPCTGRYGWPETAATDPYTNCGFKKVICVSSLDSFLVHHLPNKYVADLRVSLSTLRQQITVLREIGAGRHPASVLCPVEAHGWPGRWQKSYFEPVAPELIGLIPAHAQTLLCIGSGSGDFERVMAGRGIQVTSLPLDSVVGEATRRHGARVLFGTMTECLNRLRGRRFDCVVMTHLIHLQANPSALLRELTTLVDFDGALILGGPNFSRLPRLLGRLFRLGRYRRLSSFARSGVHPYGIRAARRVLDRQGLRLRRVLWISRPRGVVETARAVQPFIAHEWILQAIRDRVRGTSV